MKRDNLKKVDNYKIITILLFIIFMFTSFSMKSQNIYTMSVSPNGSNSIDVNLETAIQSTPSFFLSETHTELNGIINLKICYSVGFFLTPILLNNTINIPINNNTNYTLNIELYRSSNTTTCDYIELTDTATLLFSTPLTGTVTLASDNFELNKKTIAIFPNPVSEKLYFTNNNLVIDKIEIYNILGKKVRTVNHDFDYILVNDISNGVYFITFQTDHGMITKKILIQN
ncbi:T9SS type A sorting domain-containing protein [Flavobacterium sp. N2270]|uniref:T9SS type A sorting domain-containing protein n=1 Tax=Flavobacterium sp. N2270 TaxID=2986831 RepID=UPI0022241B54|nr:T9SS type A sorting domain-containing protein [Flavobacterium sp. N2270]